MASARTLLWALGCTVTLAACVENEDPFVNGTPDPFAPTPPDDPNGPVDPNDPNGPVDPNDPYSLLPLDKLEACDVAVAGRERQPIAVHTNLARTLSPAGLVWVDGVIVDAVERTQFPQGNYQDESFGEQQAVPAPYPPFAEPTEGAPFWRSWTGVADAPSRELLTAYDAGNRVDPTEEMHVGASFFESKSALQVFGEAALPAGGSAQDVVIDNVAAGRAIRLDASLRFEKDPACHIKNLRAVFEFPDETIAFPLSALAGDENGRAKVEAYFKWTQEKQLGAVLVQVRVLTTAVSDVAALPKLDALLAEVPTLPCGLEDFGACATLSDRFAEVLEEFKTASEGLPNEEQLRGREAMPEGWRVVTATGAPRPQP